jgi:hypothetical protein
MREGSVDLEPSFSAKIGPIRSNRGTILRDAKGQTKSTPSERLLLGFSCNGNLNVSAVFELHIIPMLVY